MEATTGPLGQGFAMGVGMAMASRFLANCFNKPNFPIVNNYTYAIVSDGDLMEGISSEAASLAGTLQLGKIIYLYDDNHISIEGETDMTFTESEVPTRVAKQLKKLAIGLAVVHRQYANNNRRHDHL